MSVYCVFATSSDGDGCIVFTLEGVASTIEKAIEMCKKLHSDKYFESVISNKESFELNVKNYIHIGSRNDCMSMTNSLNGEKIIEEMKLDNMDIEKYEPLSPI